MSKVVRYCLFAALAILAYRLSSEFVLSRYVHAATPQAAFFARSEITERLPSGEIRRHGERTTTVYTDGTVRDRRLRGNKSISVIRRFG